MIACWATLVPTIALAQGPEDSASPEAEARALFQLGATALRAGDFAEAKARLEESLGIHQHPRTAYNLAHALHGLGEVRAARDTLRALQAGNFGVLDEGTSNASVTLLETVRADISTVEIHVHGVETALIIVDGHEHARILSSGPPLLVELDPGEHAIQALSEDRSQSSSERLRIERGDATRVELQINDLRVQSVPDSGPTREANTEGAVEEESSSIARSPVFWLVVTGVVAGGIVAAVFLSRKDPIEDDIFGVTPTLRRP